MQRDLERLSKNEDGPEMINTGATLTTSLALLEIPIGQGPQGAAVFTGGHWEVGVGVRPDVGPLRQLVDEDEGGTSGDGGRHRAGQQGKYLQEGGIISSCHIQGNKPLRVRKAGASSLVDRVLGLLRLLGLLGWMGSVVVSRIFLSV